MLNAGYWLLDCWVAGFLVAGWSDCKVTKGSSLRWLICARRRMSVGKANKIAVRGETPRTTGNQQPPTGTWQPIHPAIQQPALATSNQHPATSIQQLVVKSFLPLPT